jgi:hypothetical protein
MASERRGTLEVRRRSAPSTFAAWPARGWSPAAPSPLSRATGGLVGLGAVSAGVILAVVFAATLAVALILGSAALALTALAWRLGARRPARIEARGHSWIAYGLERRL